MEAQQQGTSRTSARTRKVQAICIDRDFFGVGFGRRRGSSCGGGGGGGGGGGRTGFGDHRHTEARRAFQHMSISFRCFLQRKGFHIRFDTLTHTQEQAISAAEPMIKAPRAGSISSTAERRTNFCANTIVSSESIAVPDGHPFTELRLPISCSEDTCSTHSTHNTTHRSGSRAHV